MAVQKKTTEAPASLLTPMQESLQDFFRMKAIGRNPLTGKAYSPTPARVRNLILLLIATLAVIFGGLFFLFQSSLTLKLEHFLQHPSPWFFCAALWLFAFSLFQLRRSFLLSAVLATFYSLPVVFCLAFFEIFLHLYPHSLVGAILLVLAASLLFLYGYLHTYQRFQLTITTKVAEYRRGTDIAAYALRIPTALSHTEHELYVIRFQNLSRPEDNSSSSFLTSKAFQTVHLCAELFQRYARRHGGFFAGYALKGDLSQLHFYYYLPPKKKQAQVLASLSKFFQPFQFGEAEIKTRKDPEYMGLRVLLPDDTLAFHIYNANISQMYQWAVEAKILPSENLLLFPTLIERDQVDVLRDFAPKYGFSVQTDLAITDDPSLLDPRNPSRILIVMARRVALQKSTLDIASGEYLECIKQVDAAPGGLWLFA